ncbi:MAG TPA: class I SAM-dependent RNA methyltransferase [Acidimicrobiia bacterium]|nr:class I SAM-dependent RNA methyltransferase [Acidimicrobiia bacterium]
MIELHPHGMAHGGEAVARRDGKAHFVAGALPGEVIEATVVEDKGSWARAELIRIVEPVDERRTAPCPHAATCGGCQWQFVEEAAQRRYKRETVISQLTHMGKLTDPVVHEVVAPGPDLGYRNRMDFHVVDGSPGLMRPRSNDPVALDVCLLIEPTLAEVFERLGDLAGLERLTIRAGTRTGDLVTVVEGTLPADSERWGTSIARRTPDGLEPIVGGLTFTEIVDGSTFTIPVDGFFQNNTHGADALVVLARAAASIAPHETLLDAYSGVGLFGATVGRDAGLVLGIDSSDTAIGLARRNLSAAGVAHRYITGSITRDIERLDAYWDVAIVDPPRKGLGERGVDAITSAMPRRVVYVSCDPASLARDARILAGAGYSFVEATPVDMFPQTYHVEVVATFDRDAVEGDGTTG